MTTYTEGERVDAATARELTGDWTAAVVFEDDLGGGSECIRAHRLGDGRALVHCTGTGNWLIPAGVDVEGLCEREAHQCYVAAGFNSPYA